MLASGTETGSGNTAVALSPLLARVVSASLLCQSTSHIFATGRLFSQPRKITPRNPQVLSSHLVIQIKIDKVCPEGIQPCNMKNRDIY